MEVKYRRDMEHNYMILKAPGEMQGNEYQVRMLLVNEIPGLLRCKLRKIDGVSYFYYEITSRQPLSRIFEYRSAGYEDIRAVALTAGRALEGIARYLLADDGLVLEPEFIYMDVETKEVSFCYLPFYGGDLAETFHSLSEYLLKNLNHEDEQAVLWGYQLYSGTMEENYSVSAVIQGLHEKVEKGKIKSTAEKKEESQAVRKSSRAADMGRREAEQEGEKAECKQPVSQRMTGQAYLEQKEKRMKTAGMVLVVLLCCAGLAAILLLRILTLTQAGGVLFLAAGAFYYLVMGRKEEREKEEAGQKKSRWERKKSGGRKQEKSKYKRKQRRLKRGREKQDEAGYKGGERGKAEDDTEEKAREVYLEREQGRTEHGKEEGERTEYREAADMPDEEICDFQEESGEELYGQTTLLGEGTKGAYPVLISSSPEARGNVVIDKEKFVIGKLRGQVDMTLNLSVISRIHAEIERREEGYFLVDLNSTNGTYLNGERLEANEYRKLHTGDEICFAGAGYYFKE